MGKAEVVLGAGGDWKREPVVGNSGTEQEGTWGQGGMYRMVKNGGGGTVSFQMGIL